MADDTDDILRQFNELIAGADVDDLRALGRQLLDGVAPPRLRPRLDQPLIYRIRVSRNGSCPPLWRRLELRSDLMLDVVHLLLRAAFGWEEDLTPHAFLLGAEPAVNPAHVRLDQTLQHSGDRLECVNLARREEGLTLRLEALRPATDTDPGAVCTDGNSIHPAKVAAAFARLDPFATRARIVLPAGLAHLVDTAAGRVPPGLGARVEVLARAQAEPPADAGSVLAAIIGVLTHVGQGLALTPTGYLHHEDTRALAALLPAMAGWAGPVHWESDFHPVWQLRVVLRRLGLVRRFKGELLCTKAGRAGREDPRALWLHVADRVAAPKRHTFDTDATALVLLYAATGRVVELESVGEVLSANGWQVKGGDMGRAARFGARDLLTVLQALAGFSWGGPTTFDCGQAGQQLATAALLRARG